MTEEEPKQKLQELLDRNGITVSLHLVDKTNFPPWEDKPLQDYCNCYAVKINREGKGDWFYLFFDSIWHYKHNKEPSALDVLSCLWAEPVPETLHEFVWDFGGDISAPKPAEKAKRRWLACLAESVQARHFLGDILSEIQELTR